MKSTAFGAAQTGPRPGNVRFPIKRHQCPEAQGFYFGKPMLPNAVARLFAASLAATLRA
jgi:hypothetical protein